MLCVCVCVCASLAAIILLWKRSSVAIAIVGFIQNVAIGKTMTPYKNIPFDPNQDLFASGYLLLFLKIHVF